MTATRLVAKPYQPEAGRMQERGFIELARRIDGYEIGDWKEVSDLGDCGHDISKVRFAGLRALGTTVDPGGGYLVDSRPPMTAIEYLGHQLAASKAGAIIVPATAADFSPMPKEITPPVPYWVDDEFGSPPDQTPATWGVINPRLRSMVCWSDLTLQLKVATGGAADRIVTRSFFRALARGADKAIFQGSGVDGEPMGIVSTPGVEIIDGSTFTSAKATSMLQTVEEGNGANIAWAMAPDVAALFRVRSFNPSTGGDRTILQDDRILNRPAFVSTGIAAGTLYCGDFSNVVALLRAIELNVDRSSRSRSGITRLVYYLMGDVLVLQPQAFSIAQGVS